MEPSREPGKVYETVDVTVTGKKPKFTVDYSQPNGLTFSTAHADVYNTKKIQFNGTADGLYYRNTSKAFPVDFTLSNPKNHGDQYTIKLNVNLGLSEVDNLFK